MLDVLLSCPRVCLKDSSISTKGSQLFFSISLVLNKKILFLKFYIITFQEHLWLVKVH